MSDEEELTIARMAVPDLVLTGIALPGIDGVEATRQLKTNEPMASIHVIALTASMMQIDRPPVRAGRLRASARQAH